MDIGSGVSYRRDSGAKARCHADTLRLTAYRPLGDTSLVLGYVHARRAVRTSFLAAHIRLAFYLL